MALNAPRYIGPNINDAPNVRAGPTADASAFGSNSYRDLSRFGEAVTGAGVTGLGWAQKNQRREDEAFVGDEINQRSQSFLEQSADIFKKRGRDADNAPGEVQALLEKLRGEADESLKGGNPERQRMFDNAWREFSAQKSRSAEKFRQQQIAEYEQQQPLAENMTMLREVELALTDAMAGDLVTINPGGRQSIDAYVSDRIKTAKSNIAKVYAGSPPELIKIKQREAEQVFQRKIIETYGAQDPQTALDYMDSDEVTNTFGPAELNRLREKYEKLNDNANLFAQAQALVGEEGATSRRIMEEAARLYPDDKAKFNELVQLADNYNMRVTSEKNNEVIAARQAVWDEWKAAKYDPQKMPAAIMNDPDSWMKAIRFAEFMSKVDFEKTTPNFTELDRLYENNSPQQLRGWLANEDNYLQLQGWTAGRSDELTRILKKSRGEQAGGRIPGFKFDEKITRNILRNNVNLGGGWFGDETKMNDAVNACHDLFYHRMGEEKNKNADPKDVYYDLMREIAANPDLLNKSSLDFRAASAEAIAADPVMETINPITGKTEISVRNGDTVSTFVKMDSVDRFAFGDIDIREGLEVPMDAAPGMYRGVSYQPGDKIGIGVSSRTGRADQVIVFDSNWNLRPQSVDINIAQRGQAPAYPLPPEQPVPPKTPKMLKWEKENQVSFVWQKYAGVWIAEAPDVNNPNDTTRFEANPEGTVISHVGRGGFADADFLPADDDQLGNDILQKIAILESKLALSETDPRTRKNVEEDMRLEIARLKVRYDRVTGKAAKESKFYTATPKPKAKDN